MRWCDSCGKPVTDYEALHEVFSEGDSLGDKYIEYHCPECGDTLSGADRCRCGAWKSDSESWCPKCTGAAMMQINASIDDLEEARGIDYKKAKDLLAETLAEVD